MKTPNSTFALGLFLCLLFIPHSSSAYFTTAQSATKLTDSSVLYTVTYAFGFAKRDVRMPIVAHRDLEVNASDFALGYSFLDDDENVLPIGQSAAIVLTSDPDVEIHNNEYYVPTGKAGTFTLMALISVAPEDIDDALDMSLLVTRLPFIMNQDGQIIDSHLNEHELAHYRTPEVTLEVE